MTSVISIMANQTSRSHLHVRLAGPGLSPFTNQAIFMDNGGATLDLLLRSGEAVSETGGTLSSFRQVLQCGHSLESLAIVYKLRNGVNGITAKNDSGILRRSLPGAIEAQAREGVSAGGAVLGEISRASFYDKNITFAAPLTGVSSTTNQALYEYEADTFGTPMLRLRKGNVAPDVGEAKFASFLGETLSSTEDRLNAKSHFREAVFEAVF